MTFIEALQSSFGLFLLLSLTYIPFAWLSRISSNSHSIQFIDSKVLWKTPFFPLFQALKLLFQKNHILSDKGELLKNMSPLLGIFFLILFFAGIPFTLLDAEVKMHLFPKASFSLLFTFYFAASLTSLLSGLAGENALSKLDGLQLFVIRSAVLFIVFIHVFCMHILSKSMQVASIMELQNSSPSEVPSLGILINPIGFIISIFVFALLFKKSDHGRHDQNRDLLDNYRSTSTGANLLAHLLYENWDKLAASSLLCLYFLGGASLFGLEQLIYTDHSYKLWILFIQLSTFFLKSLILSYMMVIIQKSLPTLRYQQILTYIWAVLLPLSIIAIIVTLKITAPVLL